MNSSSLTMIGSFVSIRHRVKFLFPDKSETDPKAVSSWNVANIQEIPDGAEGLAFESFVHVAVNYEGRVGAQEFEGPVANLSGLYVVKRERPQDDDPNYEHLQVHPKLAGKVWVLKFRPSTKLAA